MDTATAGTMAAPSAYRRRSSSGFATTIPFARFAQLLQMLRQRKYAMPSSKIPFFTEEFYFLKWVQKTRERSKLKRRIICNFKEASAFSKTSKIEQYQGEKPLDSSATEVVGRIE